MSGKQTVSTKQKRIAENARNLPEASFTALAHHIDQEWLRIAQQQVRRDGAVGIDGATAEEYEGKLDENLRDLENRMKSGRYATSLYTEKSKREAADRYSNLRR